MLEGGVVGSNIWDNINHSYCIELIALLKQIDIVTITLSIWNSISKNQM